MDGAGTEGGAYLWREADLDRLLDRRERELVALAWAMQGVPEHDAGYLPRLQLSPAAAARELGLDPAEAAAALERARAKLLLSRAGRDLPRDGKVLAAWNGLMLSALSAAARTFGEPYRAAGQRLRDHLVRHAWDGRRLSRAREGAADLGAAGLEDYALVARGLADWADTADSREDRALALRLVRLAWQLFYQDGWRLGADRLLPAQPAAPALPDGPLPAPSALLIGLTLELAEPGRDGDLLALARAALALGQAAAAQQPFTYAGTAWLMAQGEAPSEGGVVPSAAAVGDVPEPDRAVGPGHERSAPR